MMASFFEMYGTKLDLWCVLLFVEIFADFHYLVQVVLLAVYFNSFFMLSSLDI